MNKLTQLAQIEGMTVNEMLESATYDSIAVGICTNKDCDYTTEVEPDCYNGYCENCGTNTVKSCLALAGII